MALFRKRSGVKNIGFFMTLSPPFPPPSLPPSLSLCLLRGGPAYGASPVTKCQPGVFHLRLHCYAQASWRLSLRRGEMAYSEVTYTPSGVEVKMMSHQPLLSIILRDQRLVSNGGW